ncbi:MAG: N-acetyltransferase [Alphaproteobacteria bacterium]|nr:N-acetyltransferase [Alphaproteobacteria bacterium]
MNIRNENQSDYRSVEEMIKKTFWNLYVPGCNEHYFAHQVRKNKDYIPELDFVLEEDGKIIGHILYVKAKLVSKDGIQKDILSFGPFTIHPDYQRKGYGRKLLNHSLNIAKKMGYDTVVIWGNPENYACYGFKNCKRYNVCIEEGVYPVALMVKVLKEDALSNKHWKYIESSAHQLDESGFEAFDSSFEHMEKGYSYTQELFYIYSKSNVIR